MTVRHWLGSSFLHCVLLLYPGRQHECGQICLLCGGGHSIESPILPRTNLKDREKRKIESKNTGTCMRYTGKVYSVSKMCAQSGHLARGGRFPRGSRCGGGPSMCRFQQFRGAREWPPTPSVS